MLSPRLSPSGSVETGSRNYHSSNNPSRTIISDEPDLPERKGNRRIVNISKTTIRIIPLSRKGRLFWLVINTTFYLPYYIAVFEIHKAGIKTISGILDGE